MERPLVVGVDGSAPSLRAVDWAADEAALHGVPLRLVHASLWERYEGAALAEDLGKPSEQTIAEGIVDAAARRARERRPEVKVFTGIVPEEPEYALVHEGHDATALVLGARGRGGIAEFLLGSVSLGVAAYATCPVVVLRGAPDGQPPTAHGRIVLGVGEEAHGTEAVRFAFEEAERRGAVLEAVRAWRCPARESTDHPLLAGEPARLHERHAAETLETALDDAVARYPTVRVHRRTAEGPAHKVLLDASADADLLVVGAARRHKEHRFGLQLGRVAHTALHHAACPVAVVPHRAHPD
ncbi:universal stress protein [Streptomyces heilongjiangensis]|uniref:Universal stress protein n=1 Tax=Streptomyces heilongjiangensis TaxID=945052 RepID=A0ABW1BHF1_9ACTN|nr:universal stress protein [Streptomyces heilongjiangensis]MDC2950146.1 universal stress protein [Streptomyces heilongjiangensis]